MGEATTDIEQLMDDYEDVWNGDFSKLDVVSESFEYYAPEVPEEGVHGPDGFEAYLRELLDGFPDATITLGEMLAGDEVVMVEWTATGTHEGEFNGIPPTEREADITGMSKVLISDGKVTEERGYYDYNKLFEQLGLTEEGTPPIDG